MQVNYLSNDAARDAYDAEITEKAIEAALAAAKKICDDLVGDWQGSDLRPGLTVDLIAGEEDQPVFAFSLQLGLDEDFDAIDYPVDEMTRLKSELRTRIAASEVDSWDWIVTARIKSVSSSQ